MDSNSISRACLACALFASLLASLISETTLAADFHPFYANTFGSPATIADWTVTSGNWQIVNGDFRATTSPVSVATIDRYAPAQFGHDTIGANFSLNVYGTINANAANASIGAVFDFADADNFHEVTVSASGIAQLRSRIGGVSRTLASVSSDAPGANEWIHITLVRSSGRTTLRIDGVLVFDNVAQRGLQAGDAGLISRNTSVRFDDLDVRGFGRQDPYREDFDDGAANGWQPLSGTWSAASKIYTSTAVVPTAITRGPLHRLWDVERATADLAYTFKVRMLNPYGGSGNLVGIAWVRDAANYTEAVFSPTGEARLNKIVNGVRSRIATAAYLGGARNTWFEVEVGNDADNARHPTHIKVNGVPVFDAAPSIRDGELSLITHWSPARFDNVRAAPRFLGALSEDFADGNAQMFVRSGTWSVQDNMFSSTAVVPAGRAFVRESAGWHELADIEFRARMLNRFGASGNLVGFTYGARGSVYYEAVFSPTGVTHLRKVVKDVVIPIASARYEGGGLGQWFDAQLIQQGERTTVKVNGTTVFDKVAQPDAVGGQLGLVAHWTRAAVDDVLFAQIPVTRYLFTEMQDMIPEYAGAAGTGIRALNDHGEGVGAASNRDARAIAVLWRGGRLIDLGVLAFLGTQAGSGSMAQGINNKSEIVGSATGGVNGVLGQTSFYWKEGQFRNLGFPTDAVDINERGQIVGSGCVPSCPSLLWEPDGSARALEDLPGGANWSRARAINDRGEIVGDASGAAPNLEAVSWQGVTVEPLGVEGFAFDVNNRGQIVGSASTGSIHHRRAVSWEDHELTVLPSRVGQLANPGGEISAAMAINEHGVIVGSRATIWQEGWAGDLNELICEPLPRELVLAQAEDINERGEIAVNAWSHIHFIPRAIVLTPVLGPEGCEQ